MPFQFNPFTGNLDKIVNQHGKLKDLQGGGADEYYHLLEAEYVELSNWLDNVALGDNGLTEIPEIVLNPSATALSDIVGGIYFSSVDKSIYVCTDV